jgi:glycosyltransferase involved in cell wall biosynthesis
LKTLRVLHCAETIKGGIATYLRDLLPLQRAAFGPDAIAVIIPQSQIAELSAPAGVEVVPYQDNRGRIANAFSLAHAVVRFAREHRPQVAHVHSTFAGASVRPALALMAPAVRLIYCPHGWAWDRPMSAGVRLATQLVERVLAHISYKVVCISEHEKRTALACGLPANRLEVVLNGVTAQAPAPTAAAPAWPDGTIRLLFVGRFDRQKGVDVFCAALTLLGEKASAVLAGGSVLADSDAIELPANAISVGWVSPSQLAALFQCADVLVVPSRWEGFGLIAAEAMRAGVAVIATRVGGLPEVVVDGETGLLIEKDSPQAIAAAVEKLDRPTLQRMGKAGKDRFLRAFTMERVHRELASVYGLGVSVPEIHNPTH